MAGFFGFFDYSKPGPGVPDNAPPKNAFVRFFEIIQRKFWNLIKVNFMFLIFNIPALLAGMFLMMSFLPNIFPDAFSSPDALANEVILKFILLSAMMCVPMITVGPAQAGFTYILRNYAREEHAFLWSDFKDTALKNFKQSMIIGTINFVVTFVMLWSLNAYNKLIELQQLPSLLGTALMAVMVILFVIFAMMNLYIYQIMITFDLSIRQIYKNSLIFAIVKFLPNLGILLLECLILALSFGLVISFSQIIGIFLYILITVSFIGFLTNFYVYPKIKKFMISRIEDDEEDDDEDEDEDNDEDDEEDAGVNKEETIDRNSDSGDNGDQSGESGQDRIGSDEDQNNGEEEIKRYF